MKKIDPNVASKLIEKEWKNQPDFCDEAQKIFDSFDTLKAFVEVLDGYLGYQQEVGGFDYDEVFPFTNKLKEVLEDTKAKFDGFYTGLRQAGRMGSHFEGLPGDGDHVFVKCKTTVKRTPTLFFDEKKAKKLEKKAA